MKVFATIVSRIFEPFVLLFFLLIIVCIQSGASGASFFQLLATLCIGILLPPIVLVVIGLKTKKISNWDMSVRKERVQALSIFLPFLIGDYLLIRFLGIPALSQFFSFLFFVFIGFFIITLFWKISGHMIVLTITIGILLQWIGMERMWFAVVSIPLLAWSRVILHRHTLAQTIGGTIYGILLVFWGRSMGLL